MSLKQFSPAEVALHKSERDCWIIVRGKVYNVTSYLNDHPGGVEIITDVGGQDATEPYDDVGHSEEAHQVLEKYVIGQVSASAPMSNGASAAAVTPKPVPAAPAPAPKPVAAPAPSQPKTVTLAPPEAPASSRPPIRKVADEDDNSVLIIGAAVAVVAAAAAFFVMRRK